MLALSTHPTFIALLRTLFGLGKKTSTPPTPRKACATQAPAAPGPDAPSNSPVVQPGAQERSWRNAQLQAKLDLYESHDPIPVAQASEHSGNELWSAFRNLQQSAHPVLPFDGGDGNGHFAATVPASAAMLTPMDHRGAGFATTVHASMVEDPETSSPSSRILYSDQPTMKVEEVIAISRYRNRACPKPHAWLRLCAHLGSLSLTADACAPPTPISSAEWPQATFLAKRVAFREVIEWSAAAGCLQVLKQLMLDMPESDWQYID